ncbi:MAG: PadR family transcriptional regulator [Actinomycetota bacterium]
MPSRQLTPTSYTLLGYLSITPMSGYDLATAIHGSVSQFWPVSKSQIYKELPQLEADGLVAGTDVSQERRPDKRVYNATTAGLAELDRWLANDDLPGAVARIPELLKLFFGHRMSHDALRSMLLVERAAQVAANERFETIIAHLDTEPAARYVRATARYGLLTGKAWIQWADETLADLDREPVDATPGRDLAEFIRAVPPRSTT